LSIQAALKSLYRDAAVMVCFSAGNMVEVGRRLKSKFVVADHDASGTGQRCAEELSCRWGMSEREGEDANDLHQREGLAAVRALLLRVCR
jgi:putative DNA primase/helicase